MKTILLALFALVPFSAVAGMTAALEGCVTVKPQDHATLADPTMRFETSASVAGDDRGGRYSG